MPLLYAHCNVPPLVISPDFPTRAQIKKKVSAVKQKLRKIKDRPFLQPAPRTVPVESDGAAPQFSADMDDDEEVLADTTSMEDMDGVDGNQMDVAES